MTQDLQRLIRELSAQIDVVTDMVRVRNEPVSEKRRVGSTVDASQATMLAFCHRLRSERKRRNDHFPMELFHEPAWDMLLTLYVARVERKPMHVKTLVEAADAPITTSQRWIEQLARLELVVRTEDPIDRRRIEVVLSEKGNVAMERYLSRLMPDAPENRLQEARQTNSR